MYCTTFYGLSILAPSTSVVRRVSRTMRVCVAVCCSDSRIRVAGTQDDEAKTRTRISGVYITCCCLNQAGTIDTLQRTATHCNTLQHTAVYIACCCLIQDETINTQQNTATHCNSLGSVYNMLLPQPRRNYFHRR